MIWVMKYGVKDMVKNFPVPDSFTFDGNGIVNTNNIFHNGLSYTPVTEYSLPVGFMPATSDYGNHHMTEPSPCMGHPLGPSMTDKASQ
jgi:hypothetical protein